MHIVAVYGESLKQTYYKEGGQLHPKGTSLRGAHPTEKDKNQMQNEKKEILCRYCNLPVDNGIRRCPHCGTHNPSMNVKRAMIWTVSSIVVLYLIGFVLKVLKG